MADQIYLRVAPDIFRDQLKKRLAVYIAIMKWIVLGKSIKNGTR